MVQKVDIDKLSASDIATILAEKRAAEKAKVDAAKNLPIHAMLIVMSDSTLVFWSGRAASDTAAKAMATAYATEQKPELTIFDMCKRPAPQARGRRTGSAKELVGVA